ncbi:DUF7315 family membrane protein [Haloplanus aerogenes]|uniref:DUF7315 domain-containing protein n=1 Tax=Haloplanus aerogenes TaxID=660522 RepID=A0A3M0CY77_9EURY|nr:hypothetical protein [Haloplanus aerogenes]AZH25044.1 hypothetical protein DU502_06505 [Haloplanus aerogenes]RMB13737.1 hypothetical protein ATH50_2177 [Haloplanus aerogenes]
MSSSDDRTDTQGSVRADEGGRDVVVPMRLYKTVTVFSTLIAVVAVVFGFVLLDAATIRLSLLRRLVIGALQMVGVSPPATVLSAILAVLGLASIAFGAGVYVLGTRFRARGMGNPQEDADESSDNG